jgi:methionine aminopeptidase
LFYGNGQTHILSPGRNTIKGVLSGDMFIDFRRRFIPFDTGDGVPGVREGFIADQGGAFTYEPTMTLDDDGLWIGPKGKTYIETNFGEIHKENYVRWGGRTINDTKINGLGEFMALDEEVTPIEYGGINRMVLVGDNSVRVLDDHWTVVSCDGDLTAHFEHTIAITDGDADILSRL